MSIKTKVILVTITIIIAVIIYLYVILRSTTKEVSMVVPYTDLMNINLTALQSSILIENTTMHFKKEFPKELNDYETIDTSRVSHIVIPEGSIFKFSKAIQVKNAVSGYTRSFLLGEVQMTGSNEKHAIIYSWGFLKDNHFQETEDYWDFKKAPWQKVKYDKHYKNK